MNYPQIKPTLNLDFSNTKTLDPRINFRRGTPGAYYDGKTYAKAEENLLSYSEDFSNADWVKNESTVSSNSIAAPDGGTTADKIVESNQAGNHSVYQIANLSSTTSQFVFSVYAKAGERSVLSLNGNRIAFFSVLFDLTNGSFISKFESNCRIDSYSIVDAGNQWFRCSVVVSPTFSDTSPRLNLSVADSNVPGFDSVYRPTYTGDGSSGLYIWGAQLEQRHSVTAYTPTNGAPITKYQPQLMFASPDQPRFDHDPLTGESKGLLIEEERTNLLEYSEDISAFPQQGNIILNKKFTIAPDGTSLANSIIRYNEPDNNIRPGQHIYQALMISSSDNVTTSLYVKSINGANLVINNGACVTLFDLKDQTYTVLQNSNSNSFVSATITHAGNDWYRCTTTSIGSGTLSQFQFSPWLSTTEKNWDERYVNGDNISGLYIWGIQVEIGSFPTSYIKTSGAEADRSADNASITGENFSSWYRQDEGSLYIDSDKGNLGTSFAGYVSFHTEDFSNSEYYWLLHNSSNEFQFLVAPGVASLVDGIDTSLGSQKACVSWADDDFSMSVNGNTIQSDTDGPAKKNLAGLRIGFSPYSDSHYLNSHIKKISYYPQRLTNEQLQQLTK